MSKHFVLFFTCFSTMMLVAWQFSIYFLAVIDLVSRAFFQVIVLLNSRNHSTTLYKNISFCPVLLNSSCSSSFTSMLETPPSSRDLQSPVMNLAACRWIHSSLLMFVSVQGSHVIPLYSIVDRTSEMQAVFLHSCGQYWRFSRRKPKAELAFSC